MYSPERQAGTPQLHAHRALHACVHVACTHAADRSCVCVRRVHGAGVVNLPNRSERAKTPMRAHQFTVMQLLGK